MPSCIVRSALKWNGTRHAPGTVLELTDEQLAALPAGVVEVPPAAPPPPKPTRARSSETKAASLDAAKERVAKTTTRALEPDSPQPVAEG